MASKNYKNRDRKEVPLPEDFTWENLREGIFENMEAEQGKQKVKKPFFQFNWQKLLVAALLLINLFLVAYHLHYRDSVERNKVEQKRLINKQLEQANLGTTTVNNNLKNEKISIEKTVENSSLEKAQAARTREQLKSVAPMKNNSQDSHLPEARQKHQIAVTNEQSEDLWNLQSEEITANNIDIDKAKKESTTTNSNINQSEKLEEYPNQLSVSALEELQTKLPVLAFMNTEKPEYSQFEATVQKDKKFAIEAGGGLSLWQANHFKELPENDDFEVSEQALPNWNAQLKVAYALNKQFAISTGLTYQEFMSRFNYKRTRISKQTINALVRIEVNTFLEDSTFVYQDTSINSTELRRVQHYNKHRLLSVPLSLTYYLPITKKTRLSANLGGFVSIKSESEGRTLLEEEIVDYCHCNTNSVFKDNYGIGLSGGLGVEQELKNNTYLSFVIQHNRWLKDWSQDEAMKYKASATNFNFALGKRF